MAKDIGVDAIINRIRLSEQGAAPSTPASGYGYLYIKSDGLYFKGDNGTEIGPLGSSGSSNHAYYQYLAATLEPDAIESLLSGAFTYTVAANVTKILTASWDTYLGSAGRFEVRNQRDFTFLRGVTLKGNSVNAGAVIIDPALPTYTNAQQKYLDRLLLLAESTPQYLGIPATTTVPFLPGPYGAIVLQTTQYNSAWNSIRTNNDLYGWALVDEINDTSAFRISASMHFAVNKRVANEFRNAAGSDTGQARGSSLLYYLCPSTWSVITDPNTYELRDDFFYAALDDPTTWDRVESATGNVEINTLYQWLKLKGSASWGANAAFRTTGVSRAAGKKLVVDIYTGLTGSATANNGHVVGFMDGVGYSYTDFAHGVWFGSSGAANQINVFEGGTDRGAVGSGFTSGTIYRVRITLAASSATYEIQGGTYGALGSASWTNITPGTSSNSTTPLHPGFSAYGTNTMYVSDVRVY